MTETVSIDERIDIEAPIMRRDEVQLPDHPVGGEISAPAAPLRSALKRVSSIDPYGDVETRPRLPIGWISFVLFVVVPSLAAGIYFAFIASDQFVAQTRFVVRQALQDGGSSASMLNMVMSSQRGSSGGSGGGAGSGAGGSGGGASSEDAHVVTSYIRSRSMVDDLSKTVNLRELFRRPEADFYARLDRDATIDELTEYWERMVSGYVDATSGIVTVEVRAFRPDDAALLARSITQLSEKLVNDISERARQDTVRRSEDEVRRAQATMDSARKVMEAYRNSAGLIDPVQSAAETGKLLTKVLADELANENELFVASRSMTDDSSTVHRLKARIENLKFQADTLRDQLAGNRDAASNMAASLAKYEDVVVKQKMAETLYSLAESALNKARQRAEAQSIYLSVFVQPGTPEEYTHPKRVQLTIVICIGCFVMWSIGALIWASVEDHRIS